MTLGPEAWPPVQNWRVASRRPRPDIAGQREDVMPIVDDGGDQGREQHLVGRRDPIRVGVGREVLAPVRR